MADDARAALPAVLAPGQFLGGQPLRGATEQRHPVGDEALSAVRHVKR